MKKNLFLLVVGLLSSVMSFAQPVGWVDPTTTLTKTSTIVENDVEYYLYNVDADAWFAGGNNWWTAAVVYKTGDPNLSAEGMEHGFKFKLTDKQNDGAYHINQFYGPNGKLSSVNNKWFFLTDRADGVFFTDNSSGDTYWTFTPDNNGNFQIKSSKGDFKANSVGLVSQDGVNPYFTTDDGETTRDNKKEGCETGGATMTNKDAVCTTWALYCYGAPEAVVEWNAGCALVARMQEIFEESEENFPIDSYAEQIGNQLGTLENAERLTALLAQLNADYLVWKYNNGGKVAVNINLVNPGFETGNMNGWKALSGTTLYAAQSNKSFDRTVGNYYAEFWHKNGNYSASQTVTDMPAGFYKLSANVYSSNGKAVLFMDDVESEPIEVSNRYSIILEKENTGNIVFGVKSSDDNTSWNCVDDFSLMYLGTGGDAYANMFDETYKDKASYCYQQGLQEKLNTLRAATTQEEIQAAYKAAKEYEDSTVAVNVAAWKEYNQLVADATILANDPSYSSESAVLQAMLQQAWTIGNTEEDPTTAELFEDKTSGYNVMKAEYDRVKSNTPAGTDVTEAFIKNYAFTQDVVGINTGDPTKGWRIDGDKGGGNWLINTGAKCGECWNGNDFDFYQIIENAPVGVYQITAQGFTRAGRGNTSWGYYHDQQTGELLSNPVFGDWTPNEAHIYLNDNTGDLSISYAYPHAVDENFFAGVENDLYTDPLGEYQYPNTMAQGGRAFEAGEFKVTAFGLVAKQGDQMRIGMKGNNFGLDNWAIFTNFRLVYQAFQADIIEPEFEKAVASLGEAHIGTELQAEMNDLLGRAAAVSHSDGKAMFAILSDIYAFNVKKAASEGVFANLLKEKQNLEAVFAEYKYKCTEEAKNAAQALQVEADEAYADEETGKPTVTTEEAGQIIAKFPAVLTALKTPAESGSDDEPVDFTSVITNANMASAKGWTVETGNMATDSSNKIAEFFNQGNYNVYQQISGLPEGLYAVQVQGFYRAGEIAQDWPVVAAGTESNAMMYVINDNKTLTVEDPETPADTLNCPLRHVSAEAINENPGFGGEATITPFTELGDETPWYMPNNLSCASQFFAAEGEGGNNFYTNIVYVYVWGTLDTITLGVKKNGVAITNDWCAFSNWKLTGYGNASVKEPGVQTKSCDPVTPTYNTHTPLIALIAEATAYYESIANNEEYKEVAAELKGAIDTAILVNDNTEATQQELDDAVTALKDALDKAKKTTSISEVGANAVKKLVNGKYFKNGKLYIIKNGKIFTATGAIIK